MILLIKGKLSYCSTVQGEENNFWNPSGTLSYLGLYYPVALGNRKPWQHHNDRTAKGPSSHRTKVLTQVIRLRTYSSNVF